MILALLSGICIGIILAMPPGPVGITAIKLGLFKGEKSGIQLALGNALIDFLYALASIFATSAAVSLINNLSKNYPILTLFIQFTIVFVVFIYGFINLTSKPKEVDYTNPEQKFRNKYLQDLKSRGPILLGVAIALTNLANPYFITSLAWITVQVRHFNIFPSLFFENFIFAIGFGIGNFLWMFFLVKMIVKFKHRMSDTMLIRIRQFTGVTFIGFGTLLGYRLFTLTKWTEVLRFIFAF